MNKLTINLNKHNFKSDGIAKVIENSLNDKSNRIAFQIIKELKKEGKSFQSIATTLNEREIKTRRGKSFFRSSVKNLFDRFAKYYDFSSDTFKEGLVSIKSGNAEEFGILEIDKNKLVHIRTNFKSFKSFTFIEKTEKNIDFFEKKALQELKYSLSLAEKKIFVAYFLYVNPMQIEFEEYHNAYFRNLENVILEREINYSRTLQVPSILWELVRKELISNNLNNNFPIESIIIANLLLPLSIKEHIINCINLIKSDFKLRIYRVQRVQETFAIIDANTLIEEEYISNENGVTRPSHIKIFKSNKVGTDTDAYIKSKMNSLSKPQYLLDNDNYIKNTKTAPIPHSSFKKIDELITLFNKNKTKKSFLKEVDKSITFNNKEILALDIYKVIEIITEAINKFKHTQELFDKTESSKMRPVLC